MSDDFILTNVSIYWFTNTAASSARFYYEDKRAARPEGPTVPLGLAAFKDDFISMRTFAERDHARIVQWNTYDRGGHYSAHQVPDLLVPDLREFFRGLR